MEIMALVGGLGAAGGASGGMGILPLLGAGVSAVGSVVGGMQEQSMAEQQAKLMKKKGEEEFALAQAEARDKRREATLANSRNLAVAAASGAGASDPTVTEIMTDVEAQGTYNALTEMYKGELARKGLYQEASATKISGNNAMTSSIFEAAGTIYEGFGRYNRNRATTNYGYG